MLKARARDENTTRYIRDKKMKRIIEWIRKRVIEFLQLPATFLACDMHPKGSAIVVVRYKNGKMLVIGEYTSKDKGYREMLLEIDRMARRYNVHANNIIIDRPMRWQND